MDGSIESRSAGCSLGSFTGSFAWIEVSNWLKKAAVAFDCFLLGCRKKNVDKLKQNLSIVFDLLCDFVLTWTLLLLRFLIC